MRLPLLLLAFFICATAAVGLQARFAASEGTNEREQQPRAAVAGSRLFLSKEESGQAAANQLVPEGTHSILDIRRKLHYGDFVWNSARIAAGPLTVRVSLDQQLISVFRGGHEIGTAVILYGTGEHDTPTGRFPIAAKFEDHRSATYDAPMPFTLRLTEDGVAIHGSEVRWGAATHGCIGVPLEFARALFHEANVGDVVEIVARSTGPLSPSSDGMLSTIS